MSFEDLVGRRVADAQAAASSHEDREAALRRQYDTAKPQAQAAFKDTVRSARDYLAKHSAYDLTLSGGTGWYLNEHDGVRAFISDHGDLHFGNVHTRAGNWSPVGDFTSPTTALMMVSGSRGPTKEVVQIPNPDNITPPSGKAVTLSTWGEGVDGPSNMIEADPQGYGSYRPRELWPAKQYFFSGRIDFDAEAKLWVTYQELVRDQTFAVAFDSWLADRIAWRVINHPVGG